MTLLFKCSLITILWALSLGTFKKISGMEKVAESQAESQFEQFVKNKQLEKLQFLLDKQMLKPISSWFTELLQNTTRNNDFNIVLLYYSIQLYKNKALDTLLESDKEQLFYFLLLFIFILFHDTYVCVNVKNFHAINNYNFLIQKILAWFNSEFQHFAQNPIYFLKALDSVIKKYANTLVNFTPSPWRNHIFVQMISSTWVGSSYYHSQWLDTFYFLEPPLDLQNKIREKLSAQDEDALRCLGVSKIMSFLDTIGFDKENNGIIIWQNLMTAGFEKIANI